MAEVPFSKALRERTWVSHGESEGAGFMHDLMVGNGTREDYAALVAQHYFVYVALEEANEAMREHPVAKRFISDKLTRMPYLIQDLEHLFGEDWESEISALPATQAYVDRIEEVCSDWAGGFVAHHYTRYLGDLSGGQAISRMMQRYFGFEEDGVRFYRFLEIESPRDFKNEYRAELDQADWSDEEQERVIDEVIRAYDFNTKIFEELTAQKEQALAASV